MGKGVRMQFAYTIIYVPNVPTLWLFLKKLLA